MNDKFLKLSEEKQLRIINAGLEVFGKFDYKKASTELIAEKSQISKALLFYYFHNKLEYYKYIYNYATNIMCKTIEESKYKQTDDFFEAIEIITKVKCSLLKENPNILDFLVTATCSKDETISTIVNSVSINYIGEIFENYMKNINYLKFKDDVNPQNIMEMLSFTLEGYLQQRIRNQENIDIDTVMKQYNTWTMILKTAAYK